MGQADERSGTGVGSLGDNGGKRDGELVPIVRWENLLHGHDFAGVEIEGDVEGSESWRNGNLKQPLQVARSPWVRCPGIESIRQEVGLRNWHRH